MSKQHKIILGAIRSQAQLVREALEHLLLSGGLSRPTADNDTHVSESSLEALERNRSKPLVTFREHIVPPLFSDS